jgi:hypothetical protein
VARGISVSLLFPLAKVLINIIAAKKIKQFNDSLENPEFSQKKLLDEWTNKQVFEEPALSFEYTSGSSGSKKKVGYTKSLKNCFSNMFLLWAHDVLNHAPTKFKSGVIYISLSPRIGDHVGLEDDSEYVSPFLRPLLKRFLAVNPQMQKAHSGEEFYFNVARELLSRRDLEIISIWSPTYFLSLLEYIEKNKVILGFKGSFQEQWPHLQMISAWNSGESKTSFEKLRLLFPNVWFQGKGLLATEGPMTIPWIKANGHLPLVNQIYYRFKDKEQKILLLHELKFGETYEILPQFPNLKESLVIEDMVYCSGFFKKTPLLDFVGRKGDISDLVGEKLSGAILRPLLNSVLENFVVIPEFKENKAHYIFLSEKMISKEELDKQLRNIHHYNLARELGQLLPASILQVKNLKDEVKKTSLDLGTREGDQKDFIIIRRKEMQERLYKWALSMSSIE